MLQNNLALNLRSLLDRHEINSSKLASSCGVDNSRISRMLTGKTTNPNVDTLRPIAEFFNVSIDQLIGDTPLPCDDSYGVVVPINRLLVPLIEWQLVPVWLDIKNNYRAKQTIDAKSRISPNSFALQLEDDSYEPKFSCGSILIIDPDEKPQNRDYIIVQTPKNKATIKQHLTDKHKHFLKSIGATRASCQSKVHSLGVIIEATVERG